MYSNAYIQKPLQWTIIEVVDFINKSINLGLPLMM